MINTHALVINHGLIITIYFWFIQVIFEYALILASKNGTQVFISNRV